MARLYGHNSLYLIEKDVGSFGWALVAVIAPVVLILLLTKIVPSQYTIGLVVLLLFATILIFKPFLNWVSRRTGKFYKGRWGESEMKQELLKLPDTYAIFQGVRVGKNKGDIDFVVVGPAGIFIVETKSHSGFIGFNGHELTLNGRSFGEKNLLRQVHGQVWALKTFLEQQTGQTVYIRSVLAFSNNHAFIKLDTQPVANVFVIQKNFVNRFIMSMPEFRWHVDPEAVLKLLAETTKY